MNKHSPQRIIELWPALPDAAREAITELAESSAATSGRLDLTSEERAQLDASFEDFKHGRTLDEAEYRRSMDEFMRSLLTRT